MVDLFRRKLLKTGAAATAIAAARNAFTQQPAQGAAGSFFEKGPVRIHYQEAGRGFPLLIIPGGGLNSALTGLKNPFDTFGEFQGEYRCVAADLRNANNGQSSGPVEADRSWDSHADDQLALMDHLRIDKFAVMGFCIGGPFIWNLLKRAPNRVVAAVPAQPVGFRAERPNGMYESQLTAWAEVFPSLCRLTSIARTPEGRDVWLATIGPDPDHVRPAVWVGGNIHATTCSQEGSTSTG